MVEAVDEAVCLACVVAEAAGVEAVEVAAEADGLLVAAGEGVLLGLGAALTTLGVVEVVLAVLAAGVVELLVVDAPAASFSASSAAIRVLYSRGDSISPVGVATPFLPRPPDHRPRLRAFALASAMRYCASRPPNSTPVLAS